MCFSMSKFHILKYVIKYSFIPTNHNVRMYALASKNSLETATCGHERATLLSFYI